jgi:hypothetical protein
MEIIVDRSIEDNNKVIKCPYCRSILKYKPSDIINSAVKCPCCSLTIDNYKGAEMTLSLEDNYSVLMYNAVKEILNQMF